MILGLKSIKGTTYDLIFFELGKFNIPKFATCLYILLIIYLIREKNLLTKKINYPDIKDMKTLHHLISPVNKLSVTKII